jgi:hypothetical protein
MKRPATVSHQYLFKNGFNWEEYAQELEKYADWLEEQIERVLKNSKNTQTGWKNRLNACFIKNNLDDH